MEVAILLGGLKNFLDQLNLEAQTYIGSSLSRFASELAELEKFSFLV